MSIDITDTRIEGWIQRMGERTTYYMKCDACSQKIEDEDKKILATTLIIGGWVETKDGDYLCGECRKKKENGEVLVIKRPGRIRFDNFNDV